MYIIVAYDVDVSKINKVKILLRSYLNHVQNSLFEGTVSKSQYEYLFNKVKQIINEEKDSVIFYVFRTNKEIKKSIVGMDKNKSSDLII